MGTETKRALVLLFDGVEEVEVVTPIDLMRRAGIEVTVASLASDTTVTGRNAIRLVADVMISEVEGRGGHDILLIPGGPGVAAIREAGVAASLAGAQAESGGWVAAICAAPTVLNDAGLLEGRRYTAHFSVAGELPRIDESVPVVKDGQIITSRGAGTAVPFALEIISVLVSTEKAQEVADSICYQRS